MPSTTKKIKSIKGRRLRLTRLDECGAPDTSAECGVIVTDGFISVTISNEVESGEEYTQKNAWGDFCISEKDGDRVKWANVSISLCEVDPDILDMVGGANPIVTGAAPDQVVTGATFGTEPNPNSFAVEVWTKKAGVDACGAGGSVEWGYFVVPFVKNGILDGDITIENGPLTIGLKGEGQQAPAGWASGPHGDSPLGAASFPAGDLYGIAVTTVAPPEVTDGCVAIGAALATSANAGTPGTFDPLGSLVPHDLAAMSTVVAAPTTAWTTGQHVVLGDASSATWNGTAWVAGVAADAPEADAEAAGRSAKGK